MRDAESPGSSAEPSLEEAATVVRPSPASLPSPGEPSLEEASTVVRAPPAALLHAGSAPASGAPSRVVPGQRLAGRYTVLDSLGRGSMGEVVSAYDARLDRRVALKLLRGGADASHSLEDLATRMLREAQAMARLSHPNVVAIYDVGTLEDGHIFIAMERVEGQTLRRWLDEAPRSWRDILGVYLAAGDGLAAAHEAGLVHRDFKPENVLVGREGRARVTDFGLARAESSAPAPEPLPESSVPQGALDSPLTMKGTLLGTPRYMAPELLRMGEADARSDLFAFCVALYEALYRVHPFLGATHAESLGNQRAGRVRPPPPDSAVPAWVQRTLLKGLQADAARRPTSMRQLVTALREDPQTRRRMRQRRGLAVALVCTLAALVLSRALPRAPAEATCTNLESRMYGTWDRTVRARMQAAFLGTGLPYAQDTFTRVAERLDTYAATWVRLSTESCLASQRPEAAAQELVVRGAYCLERRRGQLHTLTELFTRAPTEDRLTKAVQAVQSLPPLEDCADAQALSSTIPLPEAPEARIRVQALQARLDQLETLRMAGSYAEALASATGTLREVEQVDHAPLSAQALYLVAQLKDATGDYAGAEALTRQALPLAARSKDARLVARTWTLLVREVGWKQARYPEALGMMLALEAAVEFADDDATRAEALATEGIVYQGMGRYDEARRLNEHALTLRQKELGADHALVAASHNNLGSVLMSLGQLEPARAEFERALQLRRKTQGPAHPLVALSYNNLGAVLEQLGRYDEARDMHEHALAIRKKALGVEHPDVASSLNNLGVALSLLGRDQEALGLQEQALALRRKALGEEHPDVANSQVSLAVALRGLGRHAEALEHVETGLRLQQRVLGAEHPFVASTLAELGHVLRLMGRPAEARAHYQHALAIQEKALKPDHPDVAVSLHGLGLVLEALGQDEEARRDFARALAVREKALGPEHPLVGETLEALGAQFVRTRQWAEAVPRLERALRLVPEARRAPTRRMLEQARAALARERAAAPLVAQPLP
jgi:eukaryotic-like serine/threonine-protein kinase